MNPLIFDIKRSSTVDGPGVRTAVFLKGCNLNCYWCHNPEGKQAVPQLAFFEEKCVGCGTCKKVCPSPRQCTVCGACTDNCPTQARKLYGKAYTQDELLQIIRADKAFFDATGGGATFSGGECMLYPDFVAAMAKKCQENGITVAVDTAGNVPYSSFEKVLPYADIFLYDIKALDPQLHRRGTDCDNGRILENLEKLLQTGKQIIIRVPVIPNFNDGDELERIKAYCAQRNLTPELLPYHNIGEVKKSALLNPGETAFF